MWLGSCVAVAAAVAGNYSSDSALSRGTSICHRCSRKKTKKERERKKEKKDGTRLGQPTTNFQNNVYNLEN